MDALFTAVLQSAPSWGVGGLLITYIVILIRREARVDESHAQAIQAQAQRHTAELEAQAQRHIVEFERLNRDHDAEILEYKVRIRELRNDNDVLYEQLSQDRADRLGLPARHHRVKTTIDQDVLDATERIEP